MADRHPSKVPPKDTTKKARPLKECDREDPNDKAFVLVSGIAFIFVFS